MKKRKKEGRINIGISFEGFCCWQGGIDFCMNLLRVLDACPIYHGRKSKVCCFIPIDSGMEKSTLYNGVKEILLGINIKRNLTNVHVVFYRHGNLAHMVGEHKIDIIFPLFGSSNSQIHPSIGYIADLQHKHLDFLFSAKVVKTRDKEYKTCLNKYRYICVNSQNVKKDLENFYKPYSAEVLVLPCLPIASNFHIETKNIFHKLKKKYDLPQKYFIISNQLWMHKNHLLAFQALEQLFEKGYSDIGLVCTGRLEDNRNKEYLQQVLHVREKLKCKRNILLLGLIPKKEQLCIMRNSIALIQPTQFEGGPGGGSVYDAVSMQVPCIVSDIAVNKELPVSKRIIYFDVTSSEALTNKMVEVIQRRYKKIPNKILRAIRKKNIQLYAERLYYLIDNVVSGE